MLQCLRVHLHEAARVAGRGQVAALEPVRRRLRRDRIQDVVSQFLGAAVGVVPDVRRPGRRVHGDQFAVEPQLDAVFGHFPVQLLVHARDAEHGGVGLDHHHTDVIEDALFPPVVAGQVHGLLGGAAAFDGPGRHGEYRGAGLQGAEQGPGLWRQLELVMGSAMRRVDCLGQAGNLVPVELQAGAYHQVAVGDFGAGGHRDGVRGGVNAGCGAVQPCHSPRGDGSLRPDGLGGGGPAAGNVGEQRLVEVVVFGLGHGHVLDAVTVQARRQGDSGIAAANDQDVVVLPRGHGPSPSR
ncbi:hypothetical protein D9M72_339020 [compost metagenome]